MSSSSAAVSISRLLRRQAQSILETNTSLAIRPTLRRPFQQKRTYSVPQQVSQSLRRAQRPASYNNNNRPINRQRHTSFQQRLHPQQQQQQRFSSSSSTSTNSNTKDGKTQQKAQSFSERMKNLSREYGWSALGVYLALSALDFPFCFAAVRLFGVERIGHYEHLVVEEAKRLFYSVVPIERGTVVENEVAAAADGHVLAEAEKITDEGASIWTQLAIAYAVHKSFIFFRVPLTAAVTPKVVKTLRGWGWNIGKKATKKTK